MRELELWILVAFVIIAAWALFGVVAFSHSYVMFLPLTESLKYDGEDSTVAGAALIVVSIAYPAAALLRLASAIRTFGIRIRRKAGAATPWM